MSCPFLFCFCTHVVCSQEVVAPTIQVYLRRGLHRTAAMNGGGEDEPPFHSSISRRRYSCPTAKGFMSRRKTRRGLLQCPEVACRAAEKASVRHANTWYIILSSSLFWLSSLCTQHIELLDSYVLSVFFFVFLILWVTLISCPIVIPAPFFFCARTTVVFW